MSRPQVVVADLARVAPADLLPWDSQWFADPTSSVRRVDGEFNVSCKKLDLSALGLQFDDDDLEPLDAFDGFQGDADEFQALPVFMPPPSPR